MRNVLLSVAVSMLASMMVLGGCHADEDDPAGQAEELEDPVRRQNAVTNIRNIYSKVLSENGADRANPAVVEVADAIVGPLTNTYVQHPEDSQNGLLILDILKEMQDPRGIPALVKALDWRPRVTEEHAIRAAQTIILMDIPDGDKATVVQGLDRAFTKITGTEAIDQRLRVEMIRALGSITGGGSTEVLVRIATTQDDAQNFLINRLAAQQLGRKGDPAATDKMIEALFLFAPSQPQMRMNDVAADALVGIGRPALEPLLSVLAGTHERANAIAGAYVDAIIALQPAGAARAQLASHKADMIREETARESVHALGLLGFPEAFDALIAETRLEDIDRRMNAAMALVQLNLDDAQRGQVRAALRSMYADTASGNAGVQDKARLIAFIQHAHDPEMMGFLLEQAGNRSLFGPVRVAAARAYALFANKAEASRLEAVINREPQDAAGSQHDQLNALTPFLSVADSCDDAVSCWIGKLDDGDKDTVVKAAYMLARYGVSNDGAITALIAKLNHAEIDVRVACSQALDTIAVDGSQAAVDRITELEVEEEGRGIWTAFSKPALEVQARLRSRMH